MSNVMSVQTLLEWGTVAQIPNTKLFFKFLKGRRSFLSSF